MEGYGILAEKMKGLWDLSIGIAGDLQYLEKGDDEICTKAQWKLDVFQNNVRDVEYSDHQIGPNLLFTKTKDVESIGDC